MGLFMIWGLVKWPSQLWQDAGQNPAGQGHGSDVPSSCGVGEVPPSGAMPQGCGVGEVPPSAGAMPNGCGMGEVPQSAGAMPTQEYVEFWSRFQRMQPQSLFAQYTDPATGKSWWYDLVTGEAVWSRPKGFIIVNNQA